MNDCRIVYQEVIGFWDTELLFFSFLFISFRLCDHSGALHSEFLGTLSIPSNAILNVYY